MADNNGNVMNNMNAGGGLTGNSIDYMSSLLTFYLKGHIQWDNNMVGFQIPNTILGFIPLGKRAQSIPVQHITNVAANFSVKIGKLLIGVVLGLWGLSCLANLGRDGFGAFLGFVIRLALGASFVIDALEVGLSVTQSSGQSLNIDFLIFDKQKADYAAQQINQMVAERSMDTNVRTNMENQTLQQAQLQQQMMMQQTNAIVGAIQQTAVINAAVQQQQMIAQNGAPVQQVVPVQQAAPVQQVVQQAAPQQIVDGGAAAPTDGGNNAQ